MKTFILGMLSNPSMSEKKSIIKNENTCTLCNEFTSDFLELEDLSDRGFILCANCEAMSTTEDIYGATIYDNYARTREGVSNSCPNSRTKKTIAYISENFQEARET